MSSSLTGRPARLVACSCDSLTHTHTQMQLHQDVHTRAHTHAHTHAVVTFDRLCVCVLIESLESRVGTEHQESSGPASQASRWKHMTATNRGTTHSQHTPHTVAANQETLNDTKSFLSQHLDLQTDLQQIQVKFVWISTATDLEGCKT